MNTETLSPEIRILQVLRDAFAERTLAHPGYSLRRFSTKLGVAAPALSEIMSGKRSISRKMATRIVHALMLPPEQSDQILKGYETRQKRESLSLNVLSAQEFHVVSDWWYFAILSLAETHAAPARPAEIARRLGITLRQAGEALRTLQSLKLIEIHGGYLKGTGKSFGTTNDVSDFAIRKNHLQGLALAEQALAKVSIEEREFGSMTMAIDRSQLPKAKQIIREFRKKVAEQLEQGRRTDVYRLQVQLFPVSKETPTKTSSKKRKYHES